MPFAFETFQSSSSAIAQMEQPKIEGLTFDNGLLALFPKSLYTSYAISASGFAGNESEAKALCLELSGELGAISVVNLGLRDAESCPQQISDIAEDADLDGIIDIRQLSSNSDCEVLLKGFPNGDELEAGIVMAIERHGFTGMVDTAPISEEDGLPHVNVNIRSELLVSSAAEACPNRIYDLIKEIIFVLL